MRAWLLALLLGAGCAAPEMSCEQYADHLNVAAVDGGLLSTTEARAALEARCPGYADRHAAPRPWFASWLLP